MRPAKRNKQPLNNRADEKVDKQKLQHHINKRNGIQHGSRISGKMKEKARLEGISNKC
jgi:hypothetical protein